MITTVVFDLDDTLYDEIEYCRSGFTSVAEFIVQRAADLMFLDFSQELCDTYI
jgi:FMN phosphatase YigB (HAD superfamily)